MDQYSAEIMGPFLSAWAQPWKKGKKIYIDLAKQHLAGAMEKV
jgi:hypothetical protein